MTITITAAELPLVTKALRLKVARQGQSIRNISGKLERVRSGETVPEDITPSELEEIYTGMIERRQTAQGDYIRILESIETEIEQ